MLIRSRQIAVNTIDLRLLVQPLPRNSDGSSKSLAGHGSGINKLIKLISAERKEFRRHWDRGEAGRSIVTLTI